MDGFYLVCGELFVEDLLQRVGICWCVMSHQAQPFTHLAPHKLLVRNLVVASIFNDVVEELVKIDVHIPHLRLWIEICSALLVELAQVLDELFIFGGSIDGMFDSGFWGCHSGCMELRRCAGDKVNGLVVVKW